MNKDNHCTLEAAQRLVDAGIVLKTDAVYAKFGNDFILVIKRLSVPKGEFIPAPCMADVWRELPEIITKNDIDFCKCLYGNSVGYYNSDLLDEAWLHSFIIKDNTNPTDALVDLLIWVRKEKRND